MQQQVPGRGKATASMVLGIISLVFAWFGYSALIAIVLAIVGLVLGVQAKKELPPQEPQGMATAGIVCSIIGLVLSCVVFIACVMCIGSISSAAQYATNEVFWY